MRTVLIGLDAFDPNLFESLYEAGRLPNLGQYVETKGYARFTVSDPPQSEVSWTSIATGLNPGGHGMFDFVHRNPQTYALHVSLLPTSQGLGGTRFQPPHDATTIFSHAVSQGYPATSLWWPATFPARPELAVRTIPGLGTPDLMGRLGVGTMYQSGGEAAPGKKIPVEPLEKAGQQRYRGQFYGPATGKEPKGKALPFELNMTGEENGSLTVDGQNVRLVPGQWSPILTLSFKVGFLFSVRALTQVLLTQTGSEIRLYALPLQLHPLKSPWPYGTPGSFMKETWRERGPFLTLGWPQDTTALEEQHISDEQFLALCESIVQQRERVLMYHLARFREGLLAAVFDTLDRVQHMFLAQRPDIVARWYEMFDAVVGRVRDQLARQEAKGLPPARLLIVSDHGFAPFDHKVHLNRWLQEQGYLVTKNGQNRGSLQDVNWPATRAYAIGLNSLYLNLAGREGEGAVDEQERQVLVHELCDRLEQWTGPGNRRIIQRALPREEAFDGPLSQYGPDILAGYAPGYRASQSSGLGGWEADAVEANHDHWAADHCMSAAAVPGVIFAGSGLLKNHSAPSYRDIPALTVAADLDRRQNGGSPQITDEDQSVIEERLKGLGYL